MSTATTADQGLYMPCRGFRGIGGGSDSEVDAEPFALLGLGYVHRLACKGLRPCRKTATEQRPTLWYKPARLSPSWHGYQGGRRLQSGIINQHRHRTAPTSLKPSD